MANAIRGLDRGYTMPQNKGFLITDEDRRSALAHLRGELQTNPKMNRLLLIRANEQLAGRAHHTPTQPECYADSA